jgi:hypothetical protein
MENTLQKVNGKQFAYTVNELGCHLSTIKPSNEKCYIQTIYKQFDGKRQRWYL